MLCKVLWLLIISFLSAQGWEIRVEFPSFRSFYLYYLQSQEAALALWVQNPTPDTQQVVLQITGYLEGRQILRIYSEPFLVPPGEQRFGFHELRPQSYSYDPSLETQILTTNRVPFGTYRFVFELRQMGQTLASAEVSLEVENPAPLRLLEPPNGAVISTPYPLFVFQNSADVGEDLTFTLRLYFLPPGSNPQDVVRGSAPFWEGTLQAREAGVYAIPYPSGAADLLPGDYAWQVECRDPFGNPVGGEDGRSEVFLFTYRPSEGGGAATGVGGAPEPGTYQTLYELLEASGFGPLLQGYRIIGLELEGEGDLRELLQALQSGEAQIRAFRLEGP